MAVQELINLDFTPGIRAEHFNTNFQLIEAWLQRERLRSGGWGLVEGFDLSYDADSRTVTVSKGTFINQEGKEVQVEAKTFETADIDYNVISHKYLVQSGGKISLEDKVYDYNTHKYLVYNPPDTVQAYDNNILEVLDEDGFSIPVVRLLNKSLWVSDSLSGQYLTVKQTVAYDRIDTIMLKNDGTYDYLWSIDSPSPSHVDLGDYVNEYCVGVIYWQVSDTGITCDFFTNHRSYRKIYVNQDNELYIDGVKHQQQRFIYFEEPAERLRRENDLWYNVKDNTLYIWRQINGEWGWNIVNDHSEIIIQEKKIWLPADNPADLQTFKFDDEELNLRYLPNSNAVTIIIDNVPLMSDQFDEITVDNEEIADVQKQISSVTENLFDAKEELYSLKQQRDSVFRTIKALQKDLVDSKTMYPEAYDSDNYDYEIKKRDIDNLRNLMTIDLRVTAAVNQVADLLTKIEAAEKLVTNLEEDLGILTSIGAGSYLSRGIGFKLKKPLAHPAFVEVTVTHQVRMKPARETFQRCAIFIKEDDISTTNSGPGQVFRTAYSYVIGTEQLEVFIDGNKLSKSANEFLEVIDEGKEEKNAGVIEFYYNDETLANTYGGTLSRHFKVMTDLKPGQKITYRISRQVWSYDQLDTMIKDIKGYAKTSLERANQAISDMDTLQTNLVDAMADLRDSMTTFSDQSRQIADCYKKGEQISVADMPVQVRQSIVGMPIDIVKPATSLNILVDGLSVIKDNATGAVTGGDIFNIYYVTPDSTRILVKEGNNRDKQDIDYWVTRQTDNSIVITLQDHLISSDALLYIVGFKRGV